MAQLLNQFGQTQEKGQLDLTSGKDNKVISCQVNPAEGSALVDGQPVTLVDDASPTPRVTAVTLNTNLSFGFVVKNLKDKTHVAGSQVEIAIDGSVMIMEASAAIARGATVSAVISGQKVKTQATTEKVIGIALDKASADGDLIRVLIKTPLINQV